MAVFRVEWALLILVILKITFATSEETCEKINTCSCKLSNGDTIDLKPVDGTATKPSFTKLVSGDKTGNTFDWNPCTPFKADGCSNEKELLCQVSKEVSYPAGSDDTSFSVDSAGNVVIKYGDIKSDAGGSEYTRGAQITLKCDPKVSGKGSMSPFKEKIVDLETSIYNATYTSSHACASSGGLSTGSILLIIFFPLLLMYLIIGVLINRYGRGIQSMPELIPNHSFWADFPYLVKDGVVFTCGCIKGACSSLYRKCNKDGYAEI